jgi:hypothetical protein
LGNSNLPAPKSKLYRIINTTMHTANKQFNQGDALLESALKSHFEQDKLPDFSNYLLEKILNRLSYEKQLKILKPKLFAAIGLFLAGLGLLVLAVGVSLNTFFKTPTGHYFSLLFTDFNLIAANWQDYSLGILESLPLGAITVLLFCLLGSFLLVDFSAHRFVNFRKALNATNYGK